MDGRQGRFRDCQKVVILCLNCVVFVKLFLNGSALRMTFAHSVWTSALLDGDWRTWWCRRNWGEFLWIRGTGNDHFFVFCSVWNVKVCLDWKGHLDLFSSASEHTHLPTEPLLFHIKTLMRTKQPQPRDKPPKHWDLLPFHLPCLPSSCYPANRMADPASTLTACHSTDLFCFN